MRPVSVGGVTVQLEAAEAGGRYLAPILVLPGLFQSLVCWRGVMSMLAHRGWDVYLLPRAASDGASEDLDWKQALDQAATVTAAVGDRVILFGADVGASLALAATSRTSPLALGLFAPCAPTAIGEALAAELGFFGRRRLRKTSGPVAAPARLTARAYQPTDTCSEPRPLIDDLVSGVEFAPPSDHAPAIVFAPENDPLVESEHALEFSASPYAKPAATRLAGRWWPSLGWENAADDVHRFLILTLSDRVVEFPDEIIED